jgi:hypothetical protein
MQRDLRDLLEAVKAGAHTPESFAARLEAIHRAHLGAEADDPTYVEVRRKAMKRYLKIPETIEHHHQLERLAKALGVESTPAAGH